jgi:hypothetical protein
VQALVPEDAAAAAVALQREETATALLGPPGDGDLEPPSSSCLALVPVCPSAEMIEAGYQITSFTGAVEEAANPSENEIGPLALMPAAHDELIDPYGESRTVCL